MFSFVKDEKVVKPPQIPTINNSLMSAVIHSLLIGTPAKNPMMKLPKILTASVPIGNAIKHSFVFHLEIMYRPILPINPPRPTSMICFINLSVKTFNTMNKYPHHYPSSYKNFDNSYMFDNPMDSMSNCN